MQVLGAQKNLLGAQKNRLIEMVLWSTHNLCFGWEPRKLIYTFSILSGSMSLIKQQKIHTKKDFLQFQKKMHTELNVSFWSSSPGSLLFAMLWKIIFNQKRSAGTLSTDKLSHFENKIMIMSRCGVVDKPLAL